MKYELQIRAAARRDIAESQEWYAAQSPSAGDRFINELDAIFSALTENPLMYPKIRRDARRALMRRFPYSVYFAVNMNQISILRVLHQARDPRRWPPG